MDQRRSARKVLVSYQGIQEIRQSGGRTISPGPTGSSELSGFPVALGPGPVRGQRHQWPVRGVQADAARDCRPECIDQC